MKTSPAIINTGALAISSGLNFVAFFLWSRLLDPASFGVYSLVSSVALLLNAACFEWLRQTGARTLYDPNDSLGISPAKLNGILILYLGVSLTLLPVVLICWAGNISLMGLQAQWWPLIFVFVLTEMLLGFVNMLSRVRAKAWQYFRSMVARSSLSILLGAFLVLVMGWKSEGVILGIILAQGGVGLASLVLDPLWRRVSLAASALRETGRLFAFGYPLIFSAALTYGASVTDRFLLTSQLGLYDLGNYSASADLLQKTLVFVMLSINLTGYPAVVRAYEGQGKEAARARLHDNYMAQLGVGLPVTAGFILLAPGLSNILLGPNFRDAGAVLLPIISTTTFIRCLVIFHLSVPFQLAGRMKLMIVPPAITLMVLIPAGLVGVYYYGVTGMALAALLSQIISYGLCLILAKRVFSFRLLTADAMKIVGATAVMAAALLPFTHERNILPTIGAVIWGGSIYALAVILLRLSYLRPFEQWVKTRLTRGS